MKTKIAAFCLAYSVIVFLSLIISNEFKQITDCAKTDDFAIDRIEDHFIAVNFALKNEFPVFGFLGKEKEYRFCESKEILPYFDLLKKQGPIVLFYRHPFYPFCMGILFKFFGVNQVWGELLSILLYSLIVGFLPFAGFQLLKNFGGVGVGIIASFLLLKFYPPLAYPPLQYFAIFWGFVCFLVSISLTGGEKKLHFFFGVVCVAAFLSKGVFVWIPFFYCLAIFSAAIRNWSISLYKPLCFFLLGLSVAFSPWFLHANMLNHKMAAPMKEWQEKITVGLPSYQEVAKSHALNLEADLDSVGTDFLMRHFLAAYMAHRNIIFTTNQLSGDLLLATHNELCAMDGGEHIEWKDIPLLYYNKYPSNSSPVIRVVRFYLANPIFLVKIITAKLAYASEKRPHFFWVAIILQGIFAIQYFLTLTKTMRTKLLGQVFLIVLLLIAYLGAMQPISVLFLLFSLIFGVIGMFFTIATKNNIAYVFNTFSLCSIFSIVLYVGEYRYIQIIEPISILASVYYGFLMIKTSLSLFKNYEMLEHTF